MNKRIFITILAIVAVLLTTRCQRLEPAGQTSDLELLISPETPGTKAGAASLANGGLFKNLLVILVKDNGNNKTVYVEQRDFNGGTSSGVVRFRNVANGTYTVYAFANYSIDRTTTTSFWYNKTWEQIASILADDNLVLSVGSSEVQNKLVVLGDNKAVIASSVASLLDTENPGAMLLTGKGTLSVPIASNDPAAFTLQRPFVELSVQVINNTARPVLFDQLSFGKFQTHEPKTLVFGQKDANGVPVILPSSGYDAFAVSMPNETEFENKSWSTAGTKTLYTTYLFESAAVKGNDTEDPYKMYAHVIMADPTDHDKRSYLYLGGGTKSPVPPKQDPPETDYDPEYKGNGSGLLKLVPPYNTPESITYMRRNQSFTVTLNIYYGSSEGTFTIAVSDWEGSVGGDHTFE